MAQRLPTQYRPVLKGFETLSGGLGLYLGNATQYRPVLKGFETRPCHSGGRARSGPTQYRPVLKGFETFFQIIAHDLSFSLRSTAPF